MELWQTMGERAAQMMQSRAGRNGYTQGSKRKYFWGYPDNEVGNTSQAGYSDCSSAARSAILAAAGVDIGSNTNAQIKNRAKGQIVHETEGYYPDESQLLPGDCLYFKGNTGHALDVGHVEMYIGNGQICGHGSGTGPKIKDMREYCQSRADSRRRYFMAIRWVAEGEGPNSGAGGALGERLLKKGCAGADVKEMQEQLLSLGYALPECGADGEFGAETQRAVQAFQRDHALLPDGEYGELTHAALMAALSEMEGETGDEEGEEPPEDSTPMVLITGGSVNARKGPTTGYGILTVVHKGDRYPHIATARNGWHCIAIGDGTAWVSGKYARMEG